MSGPLGWLSAKLDASLAMWGTHGSLRALALAKRGGLGPGEAGGQCPGCRPAHCCRQLYVPLSQAETLSGRYQMAARAVDGQRILARRAGGACVYLADERCSIYARRPSACRDYDCCQDPRTHVTWPSA
ncbi:MAG: YkgJ family cysteine cluster protein [Desulfarculus sp.]|nr:YkgJ family cysteine cluster protein [Desulfarculus sp.]